VEVIVPPLRPVPQVTLVTVPAAVLFSGLAAKLLLVLSGDITARVQPAVPEHAMVPYVDCPLTVTVLVLRLNVIVTPVAPMKLAQPVLAVQPEGRVNVIEEVA
jgi:hypothetical protein